MQTNLLNTTWNKYFTTSLIAVPITLVSYIAIFVVMAVNGQRIFSGDFVTFLATAYFLYMAAILAIGIYTIWFLVKSDKMFRLLNVNRPLANFLNTIGLIVVPGAAFLVTPLVLWLLVRDYWREEGKEFNWKSALI